MTNIDKLSEIDKYFNLLKETIDNLDRKDISGFIDIIKEAYDRGSNIYVCGNGGSALTASHFACDLNKGASCNLGKRFRVMPLTDNIATIMAYANDISYEDVFVEQLKNHLKKGDVVVGISGSGNSRNVVKAIEYANQSNNITIGITGFDGGILKKIASHSVNANCNDMQISEDVHMILCHLTMKVLMKVLAGENCRQRVTM
jgi:D-sedoheptulose 7-phosphate isomerase